MGNHRMGSCGCSRSSALSQTNTDTAEMLRGLFCCCWNFVFFLVNVVQHAHFYLNLVWTLCCISTIRFWYRNVNGCPHLCQTRFFFLVFSFETACFFHTLIRSRPHALVKGTCASHVCNICLQFAKHLCGMEAACLSSGQRVSAVYPHSCILGLVECWNADLQSVHWERGCASEPAQTGSCLWSFRIYSRRNTNRNTISRSWPVVVITLITLICAHDCRRHLIYKPHWTKKVAIVTTAQQVRQAHVWDVFVCVRVCGCVWERVCV